jgi:Flp pilus assembly protein TadD
MLCLFRTVIVFIALIALFAGCPQSNAPGFASTPNAVPKSAPSSETSTARTKAQEEAHDPILEEDYEAQLFAPSALAPMVEQQNMS